MPAHPNHAHVFNPYLCVLCSRVQIVWFFGTQALPPNAAPAAVLSVGAIVGIAVGGAAGVALIGAGAYFALARSKKPMAAAAGAETVGDAGLAMKESKA